MQAEMLSRDAGIHGNGFSYTFLYIFLVFINSVPKMSHLGSPFLQRTE